MPQDKVAFLIGAIIGGLVAGFVCGLIPLGLGIWKQRVPLGVGGLIACIFSGGFLGVILALPMALLFTVIILIQGRPQAERFEEEFPNEED